MAICSNATKIKLALENVYPVKLWEANSCHFEHAYWTMWSHSLITKQLTLNKCMSGTNGLVCLQSYNE